MTIIAQFYREHIWPQVPAQHRDHFATCYPHLRFVPQVGDVSLDALPILMLVALTGTGKTTTLRALQQRPTIAYRDDLPGRREIANLIVIPTAQILLGHSIRPITDREQRFFYTRTFAEHVAGGFATAYSWLYTTPSTLPIISEGIRGASEIAYTLANIPRWHIAELTIDPLLRLQRLSNRDDPFDRITGDAALADLSFLPQSIHATVRERLATGEVTRSALRIMQAEARNYGLHPFAGAHPRYRPIQSDDLTPRAIAEAITQQLEAMTTHATHNTP